MSSVRLTQFSPRAKTLIALAEIRDGQPPKARGRSTAPKKPKASDGLSDLEASMLGQLRMAGLPKPTTEYVFAPPRKWRWDGCWPDRMLSYEIQGGTRNGGKHVRAEGYQLDCDKANAAALMGWMCFRLTATMVEDGSGLRLIERALMKGNDR